MHHRTQRNVYIIGGADIQPHTESLGRQIERPLKRRPQLDWICHLPREGIGHQGLAAEGATWMRAIFLI